MSTDLLQFGVPLQIVLSRYGEHIIPRLLKEIVMILYQCGMFYYLHVSFIYLIILFSFDSGSS